MALSGGYKVPVYVHTLINESIGEHSFGQLSKKGRKTFKTNKRRSQVNFHIKMTDAPFNQYVKVKKRDQGYQAIEKGCTKLRLDDLREIFQQEKTKKVPIVESESDTLTLKCGFNIAKCVPRQTN